MIMAEELKNTLPEDDDATYTYTLTDEEGREYEFVLLGTCEADGKTYYALAPVDEKESDEYVILRGEEDEDGEISLVTIEDDEEFDKIAEFFDDELFNEIDCDADPLA